MLAAIKPSDNVHSIDCVREPHASKIAGFNENILHLGKMRKRVRAPHHRAAAEALDKGLHGYFRVGALNEVQDDFLGAVWLSRDVKDVGQYALCEMRASEK